LKAGQVADFYDGKSLKIDSANLYAPANSPSRKFHPLPPQGFDNPFPYNNGDLDTLTYPNGATFGTSLKPRNQSLVLEYRVRVHDALNPPSTQNVFTFAVGLLSSALPRFRIFTIGAGCTTCCGSNCANSCTTAFGPPFNGLPNGGGPLLDADRIVNAIGPAVSAPGLSCICHGTTINKIPCGMGLADQTVTNPSAANVAQGLATPNGQNNFGDNSRYYMVFNYVKRESLVRSPFVRVQPVTVTDPFYLEPIFTPPLSQQPTGTTFEVAFRASTNGLGSFDATSFVAPDQVTAQLNGGGRPFIQFEARVEGNTSTQLVPTIIPYRKSP
jgi:hypothetical protein